MDYHSDYQTGEYVIHPAFGLGCIMAIEEKAFGAPAAALYYRVAFDETTVWVPVQYEPVPTPPARPTARPRTTAQPYLPLRPVTPKSQLPYYREVLSAPATVLEEDYRLRQEQLGDRLKYGGFQDMCEIMRDLEMRRAQNQLSRSDAGLLEKLHHSIQKEWAASSGITEAQAAIEITEMIKSRI